MTKMPGSFLAGLIIAACALTPLTARAKGILVKIEHFTPITFCPQSGETTSIDYYVLRNSFITARISDLSGRKFFERREGFFTAGRYDLAWDGNDPLGRLAGPGFYKFELLASSSGGDTLADSAYVIIHVLACAETAAGTARQKKQDLKDWSLKASGFIRHVTEMETGLSIDATHREVQLDLEGRHGDNWLYDLRLFPYYSSGVFNWSDFVEARAGYYAEKWSLETGYRNYVEGYNDPLNLFAPPSLDKSRFSVLAKASPAGAFGIGGGIHYITDTNDLGFAGKASLGIKEAAINAYTVNSITSLHTNNVLAMEGRVPFSKATSLTAEIAGSRTTNPDTRASSADAYASAFRAELCQKLPVLPKEFGTINLFFSGEAVQKEFVCDLAALPNGSDNIGIEAIAEYSHNFTLPWLTDLRVEGKKAYFRNTSNTRQTQKFRPTISVDFGSWMSLQVQYDYTGVESITAGTDVPASRNRNFLSELHFTGPADKWDAYCSYTTYLNTISYYSEFTVTKVVCGYHFPGRFFPYAGVEKLSNYLSSDPSAWQNYYFWSAGFNWLPFPGTGTKIDLQAGVVVDNLSLVADNSRMVYYAAFRHYFVKGLSLGLSYGTPTSTDAVQRVYVQGKYEF